MKVLLISANKHQEPYPVYPLSVDYVAGAISKKNETRILDLCALDPEVAIPDAIKNFSPDLIGLSLRNIDNTEVNNSFGFISYYKKLAGIIRSFSGALLVLGGAGFTLFPDKLVPLLGADYGVVGEGERLADLIEALEKGSDINGLEGIISAENTSGYPKPWQGKPERAIKLCSSISKHYIERGGMLNFQTKRGCPFNCIYCTYPLIEGRNLRLVEPRQVAYFAKELEDVGAKYLFVSDSVFNSNQKHSMRVAEEIKKAGVSIPWGAFFSPIKPIDGFYECMKEAGLSHVEFGTEALSQKMLQNYRKPFSVEDVFEAHNAANKAGLNVAHYFMFGGPGEDLKTVNETLEHIEMLDKSAFFFFSGIRIYPGTKLHQIAATENQISKDDDLLEPVFYNSANINVMEIEQKIATKANGRRNWVIGSGDEKMKSIIARLYERGYVGPLWEMLIP